MEHYCMKTRKKHNLNELLCLCTKCTSALSSGLSTCAFRKTYQNEIMAIQKENQINSIQEKIIKGDEIK